MSQTTEQPTRQPLNEPRAMQLRREANDFVKNVLLGGQSEAGKILLLVAKFKHMEQVEAAYFALSVASYLPDLNEVLLRKALANYI